MEFVIGAASWALDKALASAKDTLAETWAASKGIGDNLDALEMELMHAQWILQDTYVRNSRSKPLTELLVKLRQVAYDADDVLDELDYYRIQDDLDGTHHATDVRDDGGGSLSLNARYTTRAIGKRLSCCSFPPADDDPRIRVSEDPDTPANGRQIFSCAWPSRVLYQRRKAVQTPKLKFDRVDMSTKMKNIVDKLKPICAKLSTIIDTELLGAANLKLEQLSTNIGQLGTSRKTTHGNAMKRPLTDADITLITEQRLYGREDEIRSIVYGITHGKYFANQLTVLPVVGPGGIGKTTFAQRVYQEVKDHFDISFWICVSINFNGYRLAQELKKIIPKVSSEKENASDHELIEQRLKNKRFLLVLDDVWTCQEDEWKKLLAPFARGREKGNVVIVTTRIPEVARTIKTVECSIKLRRINDVDFMHLFETCIFGGQKAWEGHEELFDVGKEIVSRLKGSPLAAITICSLLRDQLTLDHWKKVLESKEWERQTNDNDIMPALKLSYDYLPFHQQRCFSFLAMFPEDYNFDREELVQLWIRLITIESCDEMKRQEHIALGYLKDLVNYGFLKRNGSDSCYVVHDLLHELAMKVQSKECIRICSSNLESMQIPPSVRHLSIIVDDTDVKDRASFEQYNKNLSTLDRRLKIQKLRTLMLFGKHNGSFSKTFGNLFREATALRIIFVKGASYSVEDILYNFSRSVHLRYLKFESAVDNNDIHIPTSICRLYHLETIELHGWKVGLDSTKTMSNLVKLRHFLVPDNAIAMHSSIFEVGKLKSLQELRRFEVKKESHGFELGQLGHLVELCGSLQIDNLEKAEVKAAYEAKLMQKTQLHKLELRWDIDRSTKHPAQEEQVLENLKPSSNLRQLSIIGHGGATCPSWLRDDLSVKYLESLHLDGVAWNIFPPIGELRLVNEPYEEVSSNKFPALRRLEMAKLPKLKKWAVDKPCQLFAHLEVLIIKDCSELTDLSFSHSTCCQQKEATMNWFPSLRELKIEDCPKLFSFPPVPWTWAGCSVEIQGVGSCFEILVYKRNHHHECTMEIEGTVASDSTFWNVLAFDNLTGLNELQMARCPPFPLHHFQKLSSLKTLKLWNSSSVVIPFVEGEGHAKYQFPIECMTIHEWGASAKELTHLLTYFPNLSELTVSLCEKITGLAVGEMQATPTPAPSPLASNVEQHLQQGARGKEEIAEAATSEGLLLLPPQLQSFAITQCPNLVLCPDSIDSDMDAARIGGGLHGLSSLRSLRITYCPRFLSSYSPSSSSPCFPFPASLEDLSLCDVEGMETLLPLSNLTCLTDLAIRGCGDLRGEGLWHLLTQSPLTKLTVRETPNFFAGFEPSPPHEQEFPSSSFKLLTLMTDDVAGLLAMPICALLSSFLTELNFAGDNEVERFTMEKEEALQFLTSLERIGFWYCNKLHRLPAGLHRLPNLKRLDIDTCAAIQSLPKNGLPNSLQELHVHSCPGIRSLPKDGLPNSLQELHIHSCPGIRSLPKVGLPNSLQELHIHSCPGIRSLPKWDNLPSSLLVLDVHDSESKELRRQCRKLIGTIPIVNA